jgi:hypothetical protein
MRSMIFAAVVLISTSPAAASPSIQMNDGLEGCYLRGVEEGRQAEIIGQTVGDDHLAALAKKAKVNSDRARDLCRVREKAVIPAATSSKKMVCRQVYDDTVQLAVACIPWQATRYDCPKDKSKPCIAIYDYAPGACQIPQATKMVCGPPEMFKDQPTQ